MNRQARGKENYNPKQDQFSGNQQQHHRDRYAYNDKSNHDAYKPRAGHRHDNHHHRADRAASQVNYNFCREVHNFSAGGISYKWKEDSKCWGKNYVPVYPLMHNILAKKKEVVDPVYDLYVELEQDHVQTYNPSFRKPKKVGNIFDKADKMAAYRQASEKQELKPEKLIIRLKVNGDPHLEREGTAMSKDLRRVEEVEYTGEIMLQNIKKLKSQQVNYDVRFSTRKLFIQTLRPINWYKKYTKFECVCDQNCKCRDKCFCCACGTKRGVPSLFQINNLLINTFNYNQCFLFEVVVEEESFSRFVQFIDQGTLAGSVCKDYLIGIEVPHEQKQVLEAAKAMIAATKHFNLNFPKLAMPVQFNFMTLFDTRKITFFTYDAYFMDFLLGEQNRGEEVKKIAFILEKMARDFTQTTKGLINQLEEFYKRTESEVGDKWRETRSNRDNNMLKLCRINITPTMFKFKIKLEEETFRIIRQHPDHLDNFVRIHFTDEDEGKNFYGSTFQQLMLAYLHKMISLGIKIGGNHFKFLSYSNSQIKNHSCWLMCEIPGKLEIDQVIKSQGNFENEKNILKRFARRGQLFTTAKQVCKLNHNDVQLNLPDIENKDFNFTDGSGYLSPDLCKLINEKFGLGQCHAYQIRLAGAKGVLVRHPDLIGQQVQLRKSQIKFESEDRNLEIVRCATFSQGYLNRQIIMMLTCLGVPRYVFSHLQAKARQRMSIDFIETYLKRRMRLAMANKTKDFAAISKVQMYFGPVGVFKDIMKLALIQGVSLQKEPMFNSILHNQQLSQFIHLKKKARIMVPNSCVLIGIPDPTGTLQEGQVHVKICRNNNSMPSNQLKAAISGLNEEQHRMIDYEENSQLITGKVLATRCPCSHPGDIRALVAVESEVLSSYVNVVIFSTKGTRPEQNKMAGGDLDGDVYFVTWDTKITDKVSFEDMEEPANYDKPLPGEKAADPNVFGPDTDNLADHFIFYLSRDCLGKLANLHAALCDEIGVDGPKDARCMRLSKLQAIAVDFAKHGKCVDRSQYEDIFINEWPDWLEKSDKVVRESTGVLGELYREVNNDKAFQACLSSEHRITIKLRYSLSPDILAKIRDPERVISYLSEMYTRIVVPMERGIKQLMMTHNIANEAELFCSDFKYRFCQIPGSHDFREESNNHRSDETKQQINEEIRHLKETHLKIFAGQAASKDESIDRAIALYIAAYYSFENESSQQFIEGHAENPDIIDFQRRYLKERTALKWKREEFKNLWLDEESYKLLVWKGVCGSSKKMQQVLTYKKLFCVPWLVCWELLLSQPQQEP